MVRSTYNASTFTPFDPADTLGDLSPLAPQPTASAARKTNKCGAFGTILLVAVAVAIAAYAGPAIIGHVATMAGVGGATTTAAATGLTGVLGGTVAGAASAAAGSAAAIGAGVVGGALAGVAGSMVSQGLGVATGLQDRFSWKGVALAGLSGGVAGGIGGTGILSGGSGLTGALQGAGGGAAANLAQQGIALATGLQSKFDWTGVAVAGVVGGVGEAAGQALGLQSLAANRSALNLGRHLAGGLAGALAGAAAKSLTSGTDFGDNVLAVLPDAIATTIGNALAETVESSPIRGAVSTTDPRSSTGGFYLGGGGMMAMLASGGGGFDLLGWLKQQYYGTRAAVSHAVEATETAAEDIVVTAYRLASGAYDDLSRIVSTRLGEVNVGRVTSAAGNAIRYVVDTNAAYYGNLYNQTLGSRSAYQRYVGQPFVRAVGQPCELSLPPRSPIPGSAWRSSNRHRIWQPRAPR